MEIGVSTASFFLKKVTEEALIELNKMDARVFEIFFNSYSETTDKYLPLIKKNQGNLQCHSMHTITTFFEPQLFGTIPSRAQDDAFVFFETALKAGQQLGAKNYTMHGKARIKRNQKYNDYENIGKSFDRIRETGLKYGIEVCLENVEWAYYNHVGFYSEVKKYCKDLKTCLDIKQARISGYSYVDYLEEMGESINTVHLSDIREDGKMCLPGKGTFDFEDLFKRLKDKNFNGNMLIEVYTGDYGEYSEIKDSLDYLREIKYKIF